MGVPVRRPPVFLVLAILAGLLVLGTPGAADAGTPNVPINTDPTCPVNASGEPILASITKVCWVEYVSVDGVWVPAIVIPPTDGTTGSAHPLPGPRVFSSKGLVFVHGGFDRSTWDGLSEYCGSGWNATGGWVCGAASNPDCAECPRWERLFQLAGLGYWILAPDYRDSGNHGSVPVSDNAYDDLAGKDVDDVALGARFMKQKMGLGGVVVFGGSRGGWLTSGMTYRYPGESDGIAVISAGCDWLSLWDYPRLGDGERNAIQQAFGGTPDDIPIPPAYYERSACLTPPATGIPNISKVEDPVLIMHGTTDDAFPISQARKFRNTLVGAGWVCRPAPTPELDSDCVAGTTGAGAKQFHYYEYEAAHTFFWGDNTDFGTGHWVDFLSWIEGILKTNTSLTDGPPAFTQDTGATFKFSATGGGAPTFQCRLDGGPWFPAASSTVDDAGDPPCASPMTYPAGRFAVGSTHTFEVRANNGEGWDPTPASRTWTVDQTPPVADVLTGPANPSTKAKSTFTFAANEPFATFECQLDSGPVEPCSSPKEYLSVSGDGQHTFSLWAYDAAGNKSASPDTWTWVLDLLDPIVYIDSGPAANSKTNQTSATFTFSANEQATFECRLDQPSDGPWTPCSTPKTYTGLTAGTHTFEVKAKDLANKYSQKKSRTWTIDLTAPNTTLTSGPAEGSTTSSKGATFTFTSNESNSTFECSLDGAAFGACSSGVAYSNLGDGAHTFQVRAKDQAGNVDGSPESRTWTVDTVAPDTTITSGPSGTVSDTGATFEFTSEPGASFECALDGGAWGACTSPKTYSGLAMTSHTFQVRAKDPAGNTDASPDSRTWTISSVDTDPPETTITGGPAEGSTSTASVSFTFSSDEGGSTFQCRLDGGGWVACTSPKAYSGLADGPHTFEVKATDAASNEDPDPAARTWTVDTSAVDTTPPQTKITSWPANPSPMPATFTFTSTEPGSTFKCRLKQNPLLPWTSCNSGSYTFTNLPPGAYTFQARAFDPAGNSDPTPAARKWTVSGGSSTAGVAQRR